MNRAERRGERKLDVVLDGLEKIRRQRHVETGLDALEKARGLLAERRLHEGLEIDARESGRKRIEQDVVGDDFTVDEDTVAVTDKMVEHAENRNAGGWRTSPAPAADEV